MALACFLAAIFVMAATALAQGGAGTLDGSFSDEVFAASPAWYGDSGVIYEEPGANYDFGNAVTISTHNLDQIVEVGSVYDGQSYHFHVVYFTTLTGFVSDLHSLIINFGTPTSPTTDRAAAVTTDSSGRIIVAGYSSPLAGGGLEIALARLNPDGTFDNTFGTGGKVLTSYGAATAVAVDSSGRILVAGLKNHDFMLARYKSDGTLDDTFGSGGFVTTDFSNLVGLDPSVVWDTGYALAIDGSGRIVVAGSSMSIGGGTDFALARYNDDGTLDGTFGTGGEVITDFSTDAGARRGFAHGVAIDKDGGIVAAGYTDGGSATVSEEFALARYNEDGSLDGTFGNAGKVQTAIGVNAKGWAEAIDSSGRIVVVGDTYPTQHTEDFAVVRYTPGGNLDGSFGSGGIVTTDLVTTAEPPATPTGDWARGVAIDSLGRIVVAGTTDNGFGFGIARYVSANADLSVTLSATPNPVLSGDTITYTTVVTNAGPDDTKADVDIEPGPADTFGSLSTTQGTCASESVYVSNEPVVFCNLDLAAGATATVTIEDQAFYVDGLTSGGGAGFAQSYVDGNDPNPANNHASLDFTVIPAADLSVTASASPNPALAGGATAYTFNVVNNGPNDATGVVLTVPLEDKFLTGATDTGHCNAAKIKGKSTVTCDFGPLAWEDSASVTIGVKVAHKAGTTSATGTVVADQTDPDTSNNTATATVTIQKK